MHRDNAELIKAVEAFEIDPGDKSLGFVDRLARENNWTRDFSERVVREYKRFCILAMTCDHPVTPSEEVDQAWHLHLTYTRSYWDRFCGQTLGKPLHHEPTQGGLTEGEKFRDWYSETLASYERLFGHAVPPDIWPSPENRFRHAGDWKWINVGRHWVVPKKRIWFSVALAGCALLAITLPGCTQVISQAAQQTSWLGDLAVGIFPFSLGGPAFLSFYLIVCLIGLAAIFILRTMRGNEEMVEQKLASDQSLSVDELAVLSGGGARLAHVALARLFTEQRIEVKKTMWWSTKFKALGTAPQDSSLDRDLYTAIEKGKSASQLMAVVRPHYDRIDRKLQQLGLRAGPSDFQKFGWLALGIVLALGVLRLLQGVLAGQEVGFLIALMVIFAIVGAIMNYRSNKPTVRGVQYLDDEKLRVSQANELQRDDSLLLFSVALLGTSALSGIEAMAPLKSMMATVGRQPTSGGCGAGCSGCGGGGCGGGGCGGCGGCGG